jgi:hypothetical protein
LIAPDKEEARYKRISIGSGAETLALLDTVPIWFEVCMNFKWVSTKLLQNRLKTAKEKK